jgi:methionine-R-sulfoxide reductase
VNLHLDAVRIDASDDGVRTLGVTRWVDASGKPLASYGLEQMGGGYKLLFCYQHACPGCHTHGFPHLIRLIEALTGNADVCFAVIQTVFEDWNQNSYDAMLKDQARYALPVAFGHDDGGSGRDGSVLMQRYGTGGTPWFILIDPKGVVLQSDFHIDVDETVALLSRGVVPGKTTFDSTPCNKLDWGDVIRWANHGNPPPPRRVRKTDSQWRAQLTAEQYGVTRKGGTEAAHSSATCGLFEPGTYRCVCCGTTLFDSAAKYNSHSGWPSFSRPVAEGVIAYQLDDSHGMRRIETTCQVCDAHLGHVFPDGPEPTGLRYCMNALALKKDA